MNGLGHNLHSFLAGDRLESKKSVGILGLCALLLVASTGCQAPFNPDVGNLSRLSPNQMIAAGHNPLSRHRLTAANPITTTAYAPTQSPRNQVSNAAFQAPTAGSENIQQATYQYPASYPAAQSPLNQNSFYQTPGNPGFQPQIQYQTQPQLQQQLQNQPPTIPFQNQVQPTGQPGFQGTPPRQIIYTNPGQIYSPVVQPPAQAYQDPNVPGYADIDVFIPNNPTGRYNVGASFTSDNRLLGQIVLEERDFDLPRGLGQIFDPRAWRGGGKTFRLEAMPGQDVQRYLVSLSNPYFRGTDNSLSVSGYLFDRQFFDWDEERLGGRVNFETRLDQYLSVNAGLRMESVTIDNPRLMASPQLNATLGNSNLFLGTLGLVYDNRIDPVSTKVGSYVELKFSQAFGDYSYSRGEVDFRNHRLIYARPDQSGAHTLSYRTKLGFTGGSTPVFENFFAGGFSSMRGFDFRGVSPIENDVRVGGEFQWLNTLEYKFPLSADDLIHGVTFIDFGTVEESVELNSENFRVAPGLGLRVHVPFAGTAAPLAFDFAFPISTAAGDDEKMFSFYIGLVR